MDIDKINQIVGSFCNNNFEQIKETIMSFPETDQTTMSVETLSLSDPYYRITALDSLTFSYFQNFDYKHALTFATATYYCVRAYLNASFTERKDEILYYAGSSAYYMLQCRLKSVEFVEGTETYHQICKDYGDEISKPEFNSARMTAVELLISLNQPDRARTLHAEIDPTNLLYSETIHYDNINESLRRLFSTVETMPSEFETLKAAKLKESLENIIQAYQQSMEVSVGKPSESEIEEIKEIQELIRKMQECTDDEKIIELANTFFSKGSLNSHQFAEKNEGLTRSANQNKLYILADLVQSNETDVHQLEFALKQLTELDSSFKDHHTDEKNFLLFILGNCYSLLERYTEAVSSYERLRNNLELVYNSISKIEEKGGVYLQYPQLFRHLISNYASLSDTRGILKAVEASKGRTLADFMKEKSKKKKTTYDDLPEKLLALLKRENIHYLSFFVDDHFVLPILVTANGKFYIKGTDKIRADVIAKWVRKNYQNPEIWNNPISGLFGSKKQVDIGAELEELYHIILSAAMDEGNIHQDDHIVYSSDGDLTLFPLHYARFKDKFLIEWFSLSRVQSAYHLLALMEQPEMDFRQAVCYTAPAKQDIQHIEKVKAFEEVSHWLQQNTEIPFLNPKPTIDNVNITKTAQSIVHFSTHGVFPNADFNEFEKNNPYHNSGLLLNDENGAPALEINFDYYKKNNLLSPKKIIAHSDLFNQSHISFQACVSGRSKEGIAGDAIGMEWAALYAGAQSLLTAAWDVDIFWANRFFLLFYDNWLNKRMTKAKAYAETLRKLIKSDFPDGKNAIYYWGGFILSGKWK